MGRAQAWWARKWQKRKWQKRVTRAQQRLRRRLRRSPLRVSRFQRRLPTHSAAPTWGRSAGAARVVISHDVEHGLAEADYVLGLRGGRQALLAPAAEVDVATIRGLYA